MYRINESIQDDEGLTLDSMNEKMIRSIKKRVYRNGKQFLLFDQNDLQI